MIELYFDNWYLSQRSNTPPAYQYDDGTIPVIVTGNIPEGWSWSLLLAHGEYLDVANMDATEDELVVVLTAEQLAFAGYYTAQLRASQGEKIKHSSPVLFSVGDSLSGDEVWPEIPTAFTQAVERAEAAITTAEGVAQTVTRARDDAVSAAQDAADSKAAAAGSASEAAGSAEDAEDAAEEAQELISHANVPVIKATAVASTASAATLTESRVNLKTGDESTREVALPIADDAHAGMMTPESVAAIADLIARMDAQEGTTVRLLYASGTSPSAAEIAAFVAAAGYTQDRWPAIAVVISGTYHIWHYYANTTLWRDDGVDTVSQATATILGIVKGSSAAGKVFVEADGTMSLNGYDAIISGLAGKVAASQLTHETWEFVLPDSTVVEKDVVLWL